MKDRSRRLRSAIYCFCAASIVGGLIAGCSTLVRQELATIHQREQARSLIGSGGGCYTNEDTGSTTASGKIPIVRQVLGDVPMTYIGLPSSEFSEADAEKISRLFPEAEVRRTVFTAPPMP